MIVMLMMLRLDVQQCTDSGSKKACMRQLMVQHKLTDVLQIKEKNEQEKGEGDKRASLG
jgi:hypothetical protein